MHYFPDDAKLGAAVCTCEGRTATQRDLGRLEEWADGAPSKSTKTNAKSPPGMAKSPALVQAGDGLAGQQLCWWLT